MALARFISCHIARLCGSCAPSDAQAFLLPANGETERGVKTIDKARRSKLGHAVAKPPQTRKSQRPSA